MWMSVKNRTPVSTAKDALIDLAATFACATTAGLERTVT